MMDDFFPKDEFLEELQLFSITANPDGSDLLFSVKRAAQEMIATPAQNKTLIVITDSSFDMRHGATRMANLFEILRTYDIDIIVLSSGSDEHPWLKEMGFGSGGIYLRDIVDAYGVGDIVSFIKASSRLSYKSPYPHEDGKKHQVIVDFNDYPIRRYASYIAPVTYIPTYAQEIKEQLDQEKTEQNRYSIPPLMLMGIRIPFGDVGSNILSGTGKALLDSVVTVLDSISLEYKPNIFITGHTCDLGSQEMNDNLSVERATAVLDYLSQNVNQEFSIEINGKGSAVPIFPNDSDENRILNRRAEITFSIPNVKPQNQQSTSNSD